MVMMKRAVSTGQAPAAIGPYTQAIRVGGLLYTSGQIPLDPSSMELVAGGIAEQTEQVMKNLAAVLAAAGAGFADVVKTTVFLKDLGQFAAMNEVYGRYLAGEGMIAPARSTIEVAGLPRGSMVEIELVAIVPA